MRLFGENTELTYLAKMILDEDIDGLTNELENGWNVNTDIEVCRNIKEAPIILALYYDKVNTVEFLIHNGVDLKLKGKAVIPAAADCCSINTIKLLQKHGADINATNNVGHNAIHRALINKRGAFILELINIGMDVKKDGVVLRSAVYGRQYATIQILLAQNMDVNYHTPDMIFPYNPTAVCVAAENNDFDTVKLLVKQGADVTIKDDYGNRPFIAAKKNKNNEMMEYLKALEPEEWHVAEQKLIALKSYKLPKTLIDFLRGRDLKLSLENNKYLSYVVFDSFVDCKEVQWNGYKFLDLLKEVDQYSENGFLVWYPKEKCLASADYEHEKFKILDKWEDFIKCPSNTINKIFG